MYMKDIQLSNYGKASTIPAPVNTMMTAMAQDFRQGIDTNLGVGYVNEDTIPRDLIQEAMDKVLVNSKKYPHALNYGSSIGSLNLINSIKNFTLKHHIGNLTEEILNKNDIIIGPNAASSLLEAVANLLPKGIVLTTDPHYYIYCNFLERMGFELITIPEDFDGVNIEYLKNKLNTLGKRKEDISFFYFVTVNNPSCTILSNLKRQEIVGIVNDLSKSLGRKIPLILDKAYEHLIHDPEVGEPDSALLYDTLGLVYEVATLSKVLAPALRIGYMIGPQSPFLTAMIQRSSDAGFSAPLINQEIASYILDHHMDQQLASVNLGYRKKAQTIQQWINHTLEDHIENMTGGQAGFYFYLTLKSTETHEGSSFFKFLTRTTGKLDIDGSSNNLNPRVLYVPGIHYVHKEGEMYEISKRQLRLSYGYENLESIEKAINLIKEAISFKQ